MAVILVVTAKPACSNALAPHLAERFPDREVHLHELRKIGHMRFAPPRGLSWADFPWTGAPRYRMDATYRPAFGIWNREAERIDREPAVEAERDYLARLRSYDAIVYAAEPWHTDVGAFAISMRAAGQRGPWAWCRFGAFDSETLRHAVARAADPDGGPGLLLTEDSPIIGQADVRRHFDWLWTVNSLAVLGRTAALAGARDGFLSKYALLLLHALGRRDEPLANGAVLELMSGWTGTGRYPPRRGGRLDDGEREMGACPEFGTAASRCALVQRLLDMGLTRRGADQRVALSDAGRRMLDLLHPTTFDPDLPFRLHAWGCAGLEASRPSIERYVRTLFGRQKRRLDGR